jgi:two-component system chemotaxis response regulator CheB
MNQVKVLLVDDSSIVHVILKKIIAEMPDIAIIGDAYNGREGLELAKQLSPDVIVLDIGMPEMNGLEAIGEIMNEKPTPIIVFSGASKATIGSSFKAIDLGAVDIIEKPFAEDLSTLKRYMEEKLIRSIRTFADFRVMRRIKRPADSRRVEEAQRLKEAGERLERRHLDARGIRVAPKATDFFPVIGIAASTGGPQTIRKLLERLGARRPNAGIVIVQHMAEGFMEGFAEWLALNSAIPVEIAREGDRIRPGVISVAPGKYHLGFDEDGRFTYLDEPPIMGIRPSANIMLSNLAESYGKRVIAVVLTGMGDDGTLGAIQVKERGGYVIAQDEETSLVFGMPKSAFDAGAVHSVLPLSEMADFICTVCAERTGETDEAR